MKLEHKSIPFNEYYCELTQTLDSLANFNVNERPYYRHYILADEYCRTKKCLPIRVPGGTVGGVWINDKNVITQIDIDINYVVKTYSKDVKDVIQKYVGEVLEL